MTDPSLRTAKTAETADRGRPAGFSFDASIATAVILGIFIATRAALHFGVTPFVDGDSYKYLGGADALWAGNELPPLFRDLATTGGGLHAVPGYAWFIEAIWTICRRVTLPEILIAQSMVSLAGMLAAADVARRCAGRGAALALLAILVTAPTIAWLEHLVMPDLLAVPLYW